MNLSNPIFAVVCVTAAAAIAQEYGPFPENRVRDFYFQQAERALTTGKDLPELLPQFPGLDGGAFGHWGQNPSENSVDTTLNDVDSGNIICSRIIHFGVNTHKGVAVSFGTGNNAVNAVFDPLKLSFVDSWSGGFVSRGSGRFGVHDGARATGPRLFDLTAGEWQLPDGTSTQYQGFYRHGREVVFAYQIGNARLLDRLWTLDGTVVRSLQFHGNLPTGTTLRIMSGDLVSSSPNDADYKEVTVKQADTLTSVGFFDIPAAPTLQALNGRIELHFPSGQPATTIHLQLRASGEGKPVASLAASNGKSPSEPSELIQGGPGQWSSKTTTTQGKTGDESSPFAIDTLTIPFADANAFGTPMRLAGVGSLGNGQMAVSTLLGDVWVVSGVDQSLKHLTWQRVAAGLYQPLGLVVQDGKIVLGGNDQITRLHDLNGDGEADFYECVTNQYPTTGGHDFATSLQQDEQGRLYWAVASGDFGVARLASGITPESLGNGLRNSNGIGVSRDGAITLATVQEGTWTPCTAIFDVKNGSFHGHQGPGKDRGPFGYDLPVCFIPRGIDNSAGEICFLPIDSRLGPLAGMTVGSSYGYCNHYLVLREEINGRIQGGVVPLPGEFLSGSCRLSFNNEDGCLYVAGTEGWQSYAAENGCLQRLRYTGKPLILPTQVETQNNGLIVRFNTAVDPDSVKLSNVFCQQWNYLFSGAYGSPEYSVKEEGRQGHDYVKVESVHLLPDGKSVFLQIPQLHPVMQFHVHMRLKSADGADFTPDAYLTIYETGSEFTDFPGYQRIAKRAWPDFPKAEVYEQDPRLVQQDQFGTNFGWVSTATKISLNAEIGLQYEPRRLRVAPGSRVALTFRNADPGMPHNVVVVKADQLESIGEQAMVLASNPRAIATHYVPNDPAEICFSPIINPGDQYTVYFEAPHEPGKFKFLCTYPGHWKVMQGTLYVIPDNQPLPEPDIDETTRKFVKRWNLDDFRSETFTTGDFDSENGEKVFSAAGCNKCHQISGKGAKVGPELTDIAKRFTGEKLLKQILEPSHEINKDYQTWLAVLDSGKTISGLLKQNTATHVTLLPNPLVPDALIQINHSEIEELIPSKQSTMPDGLLMTFNREEILDLIGFLSETR